MCAKIIAEQVPPEYQESNWWMYKENFEETEGVNYRFIIHGNNEYRSYTSDTFDYIEKNIDEWFDDWYDMHHPENSWRDEPLEMVSIAEFLRWQKIERDDDKEWTDEQLQEWESVFNTENYYYSEDVRCRLLSLIEGGNWEYTELHGYVQGEWQGFYYDSDSVNREELRRIESDYFNLGTEWHCRVEGDEEGLAIRVYCYEWDDDKIREEIAEQMWARESEDEVELHKFTGWSRTANYVTA